MDLATDSGPDLAMDSGLDFATDGGTELRMQVELWRIRGGLDLGRG